MTGLGIYSNVFNMVYFAFLIFLVAGLGLGFLLFKLRRQALITEATNQALALKEEVDEQLELRRLEEEERKQEIELELWSKSEKDILKIEERIEELQEMTDENRSKSDSTIQKLKNANQEILKKTSDKENEIKALQSKFNQMLDFQKDLDKQLVEKILHDHQISPTEIKDELSKSYENEFKEGLQKKLDFTDEDLKANSESKAKYYLDIALDRFARPYSAERGIGSVHFADAQAKQNFCDPDRLNIKAIQESCGCDIIVDAQSDLVGVAGYDPVRRELTRRTLEKVLKEKKKITPDLIKRTAELQKKELFRQIKADGDQLFKELKLNNVHPEIRQMMGSLRHRYSFTQNQYFHCGEVGWLNGLLASELKLDVIQARRSGVLHDIGKSMDHDKDGGHAVIGADFIETRGESPEVIHNVRAHHYDVAPSTPHAFLVIAADAISGGRPGARRSTVESYNQKVTELQDIARSFDGVTDCYVLNGGRECRILVNGKKVNDSAALDLSKKIAKRVEEECNYPGQIKVVVIRETLISEHTHAKA
jgi:ribonuclease Y